MRRRDRGALAGAIALTAAAAVLLARRCEGGAGRSAAGGDGAVEAKIVSAFGAVERRAGATWVRARIGDALRPADTIRTRAGAHADIEIDPQSRITVAESTELSVRDLAATLHRYRLARGRVAVDYRANGDRRIRIESADGRAVAEAPAARFSVLGTGLTFAVATETGTVDLSAAGRTTRIPSGHQALVVAGDPPGPPVPVPVEVLLKIARRSRLDGHGCASWDGAVEPGAEVLVDGAPVDPARDGRFSIPVAERRRERPLAIAVRDVSGHSRSRVLRCPERRPTDVNLRWIDAPDP